MAIHIGTSGWSYAHWHGVLYPHGSPAGDRLGYYLERFGTVELNSSAYRWPADTTFRGWQRRLPPGFLLSVKAPRGLTHSTRLYAPERWLARMHRGLQLLADNCGVLLVQLPPALACDYPRLAYFLSQAPREVQMAVEFRHPSWHQEAIFDLLAQHGVAYCVMSGAQLPCVLRATAPYVYVRLHGPDPHHLYAGSYTDDDLRWWAERIREWTSMGRDVFVYFNNDGEGHAVRNATTLKWLLGV
jgi:uncharacterized protein YecE (DUF72 family)